MAKTITYLYPYMEKASSLKIYQDRTNQIRAFYFTKENIKEIEKVEFSSNYAIYFLFDNSESDMKKVYVGRSVNGVKRIQNHIEAKDFWSYCIMFVTDNNSFDSLSIDFMEHTFIQKFKKSSYVLTNKDMRTNVPNISIYDMVNVTSYCDQIEFLLRAEGISLDSTNPVQIGVKLYQPINTKYHAELFVENGKFILAKGSIIQRPRDSTQHYIKNHIHKRYNQIIEEYFKDGKISETENGIILLVNVSFDSPTAPAILISGYSANGWEFFKDLSELRNKETPS